MTQSHKLLCARDIMTNSPVTIHPEARIFEAIKLLLKNEVTGMPVIDDEERLVGIISEYDCLRVLGSAEFFNMKQFRDEKVTAYMTEDVQTIPPDLGIYSIAQHLLNNSIQRLPVVENGVFLGMVTRGHVLRGIERMRKEQTPRKTFPDFRLPLRHHNRHVD